MEFIKIILLLPVFFVMRLFLIHGPDGFWRWKLGDKNRLSIDGRRMGARAQGFIALQESVTVSTKYWTPHLVRMGFANSVKFFDGARQELAHIQDIALDLDGRQLAGRLYHGRAADELQPAILFFHGGGFVIGDLETHDGFCRRLARKTGRSVLAVAYRRGPENRFPAAMEDAYDSWMWLQENAKDLGIDQGKISLCGDSAGAALGLLTASRLSADSKAVHPDSLLLIYPILTNIEQSPTREMLGAEAVLLTGELLDWFRAHFLNDESDMSHPWINPLAAMRPENMPRCWIFTCGFDPLRFDGEAIIAALKEKGIDVEACEYEHLFHGFITYSAVFREVDMLAGEIGGFLENTARRKNRN